MAHEISGIVTGFRYEGELPSCHLVNDLTFIPLDASADGFRGDTISPFGELTAGIEQLGKDLSMHGACAYVETHYHGGMGCQLAIVWQGGRTVLGPLTDETVVEENDSGVQRSDAPINEALSFLGVRRHGENDEFDVARLGRARSNQRFLDEWCGPRPSEA